MKCYRISIHFKIMFAANASFTLAHVSKNMNYFMCTVLHPMENCKIEYCKYSHVTMEVYKIIQEFNKPLVWFRHHWR